MRKLSILLLSLVGLMALSGCVAYPVYEGHGPHYRSGPAYGPAYGPRYDRDGDGVRNRYDRRPDNPYRH